MALDDRRSVKRNERLLAVVSLSFGVGETNYSQGNFRVEAIKGSENVGADYLSRVDE